MKDLYLILLTTITTAILWIVVGFVTAPLLLTLPDKTELYAKPFADKIDYYFLKELDTSFKEQ